MARMLDSLEVLDTGMTASGWFLESDLEELRQYLKLYIETRVKQFAIQSNPNSNNKLLGDELTRRGIIYL